MDLWCEIRERLSRGKNVLLAVVGEASRHSPGTAGAMMWLAEDRTGGTIGGGAMELALQARAKGILAEDRPFFEIRELEHRRSSGKGSDFEPSGMICAGRQVNVLYLCRPAHDRQAVEQIAQGYAEGRGGWALDRSGLRRLETPPCRGTQLRSVEEGERRLEQGLDPWRRLAVLGAGHCGRALAELASGLGYGVEIWDVRQDLVEGLKAEGFEARRVADFRQVGERIRRPDATPILVMTPDVANDVKALAGVLGRGFPFVGAMGSRAKLNEIFRRLQLEGFSSEDLGGITAPVGLPIGSRTPAEIAVSVAAQLISLRASWEQDETVTRQPPRPLRSV